MQRRSTPLALVLSFALSLVPSSIRPLVLASGSPDPRRRFRRRSCRRCCRRPGSLAAGLLACCLAGATLLGCSAGSDPATGGPPSPPPSPLAAITPSAEAPAIPSDGELPGRVISLDFFDASHAFALLAECREDLPYDAGRGCAYHVAVLDGDGVWRLRDAPVRGDPDESGYVIEAAGPGRARLATTPGGTLGDDGGAVWLTRDAGRSWRPGGGPGGEEVAAIPEGARLALTRSGVVALMPDTAVYRPLGPQPPLIEPGRPGALPDGRHWIAGRHPETGQPALAVSRDDRGGWRLLGPLPTAPPYRDAVNHRELRLVGGPGRLYVFETGVPDGLATGGRTSDLYGSSLLGIHVSDDDGRSWERVWTRQGSGSRPVAVFGTPIAAADGSLVVYGYDAIHVSRDGGRSFTVERPGPPPEEPGLTRAGFLLTDLDHPGHFRISADGFTWRTVVLGDE